MLSRVSHQRWLLHTTARATSAHRAPRAGPTSTARHKARNPAGELAADLRSRGDRQADGKQVDVRLRDPRLAGRDGAVQVERDVAVDLADLRHHGANDRLEGATGTRSRGAPVMIVPSGLTPHQDHAQGALEIRVDERHRSTSWATAAGIEGPPRDHHGMKHRAWLTHAQRRSRSLRRSPRPAPKRAVLDGTHPRPAVEYRASWSIAQGSNTYRPPAVRYDLHPNDISAAASASAAVPHRARQSHPSE
ncbi:hypothetical protein FHX44_114132 [Pseudonocardia hierapolitana]|uniref:Uncharacterized protein n=1 Tax=Pseudonocardia hierapolitana TaxID=1128676 RepID=A0A561STQ3_9PSEU|nr:hypothetical protein FHX44_114132 [Pseudonocardia hierapolitana]